MDWLKGLYGSLTLESIILGVIIFVLSLLMSVLIVGVVIIKLPANYFSSHYTRDFLPNSSWFTRWGAVILKNVVGLMLIIAGFIMLIGPGQGILTILIGLILMDIPGKRPLETRIIKKPAVLKVINDLRARFGKPPLVVD